MARAFAKSGTIAQRSYIVDERRGLAYLIVYKAACSSIMASLCGIEDEEHYLRIHHMLGGKRIIQNNVRLERYADAFAFTFVRNPLERLVSCYESKYHADRKHLGRRDVKRLYFDHYLLGLLKRDRGFTHFARMVCRIPDCLADRHFISQSVLLDPARVGRELDFVGKFEGLHAQYGRFRNNTACSPCARNVSEKNHWMDYYDLPTARRVIHRYRRDLDALGYRESADQLLAYVGQKGTVTAEA